MTGHIQTFRDCCHGQFKALHDVEISALDTAVAICADRKSTQSNFSSSSTTTPPIWGFNFRGRGTPLQHCAPPAIWYSTFHCGAVSFPSCIPRRSTMPERRIAHFCRRQISAQKRVSVCDSSFSGLRYYLTGVPQWSLRISAASSTENTKGAWRGAASCCARNLRVAFRQPCEIDQSVGMSSVGSRERN
jgi:hypothetical protein